MDEDVLESKRLKWDTRFISLAQFVSQWSKDPSTKVGAVIADRHNRIISLGYNGFPARLPDDPAALEDRETKYKHMLHAEQNAILFARRDLTGCTIYIWPLLPCVSCTSVIIQSGLSRVVSISKPSKRPDGSKYINFDESVTALKKAGLAVHLI